MGHPLSAPLFTSLLTLAIGGTAAGLPPSLQARAALDPHRHHPGGASAAAAVETPGEAHGDHHDNHDHHNHGDHGDHGNHAHLHDVGPAGATYDLRFLDAMVQHHTGALRMSEMVFGSPSPGVGALARRIWRDQAEEIRAMGLWRRSWYPDAPVYPVTLRPQGDPDSLDGLTRKSWEQIEAMRMMGDPPSRDERVVWFLERMIEHHGGALMMAHDALDKSGNSTVRRFARDVILAQRGEIIELRRMLRKAGLRKQDYFRFDPYFSL